MSKLEFSGTERIPAGLLSIPRLSQLHVRDVRPITTWARDNSTVITRREAVRLLGSASAVAWLATQIGHNSSFASNPLGASYDSVPALAPGAPMSTERIALIGAFKKQSEDWKKSSKRASTKLGNSLSPLPSGGIGRTPRKLNARSPKNGGCASHVQIILRARPLISAKKTANTLAIRGLSVGLISREVYFASQTMTPMAKRNRTKRPTSSRSPADTARLPANSATGPLCAQKFTVYDFWLVSADSAISGNTVIRSFAAPYGTNTSFSRGSLLETGLCGSSPATPFSAFH
jgi:hypothetical protein